MVAMRLWRGEGNTSRVMEGVHGIQHQVIEHGGVGLAEVVGRQEMLNVRLVPHRERL